MAIVSTLSNCTCLDFRQSTGSGDKILHLHNRLNTYEFTNMSPINPEQVSNSERANKKHLSAMPQKQT